MNKIETINGSQSFSSQDQARALDALESGSVLFLPNSGFPVEQKERVLFSPSVVGTSKNVSFTPRSGEIGGTTLTGEDAEMLRLMMKRFSESARNLIKTLLPSYESGMIQARSSFRPVEIEGRPSSWRKDDTRLHVDSFPANPTQGKRILRVFINVNPEGRARTWRVGEPFENVASRFLKSTHQPFPGTFAIMHLLRITKSKRTAYDQIMLQLHDLMKSDDEYQKKVDQLQYDFPAGSTWIAYADQVSHAVMKGQYQLEQTFLIPVAQLHAPERSPLRVLERLAGRALV